MLIRFNVKNFLSFADRDNNQSEEFSMIAGKVRNKREHIQDDDKLKLLKFAAVFGANASGKSNLVKALAFMQKTVHSGLPDGYSEMYCKTSEGNQWKNSYFELEMVLKDKYYSYGFEVILSEGKFVSEWLIELLPDGREKVIFNRDIHAGTYKLGSCLHTKGLSQKMNVYAEDIQEDGHALLLNIMNHNKGNLYRQYKSAAILKEIYSWITESLDINYPDEPISSYSYMANTENIETVYKLIAAFGTGIHGFRLVDIPMETVISHLPKENKERLLAHLEETAVKLKMNSALEFNMIMRSRADFFIISIAPDGKIKCKTIKFSHNNPNILFDLSEESDGTIRILDLLEILLSSGGKTYVIDELDRCLHPNLTYQFVKTYLTLAAKKEIQLIVTTHESRLLDFDLLRRDEIWFINKRESGESDIYSLEEYNARFDQKIDKAYLEGRYGGVPVFSTVFPLQKA